jgi:hypothetical protein
MRISERIKSLFRRQPPTADELAARTEAERVRDQFRQEKAVLKSQVGPGFGPGSLSPSGPAFRNDP